MINTPQFLNSHTWILDNLRLFDRQAYIDALLVQYPTIPEEFRIWTLEWPARLAVAYEPSLFGRVYVTDFMELESSAVIPHERQPKPEDYDYPEPVYLDPQGDREFTERGPYGDVEEPVDSEGYLNVPYADWMCYLEHQWALSVGNIQNVGELHPYRDKAIPEPVKTVFDHSGVVNLLHFHGAHDWNTRNTCIRVK
ncbi:hypothetical protein CVT25_004439 [Psilocybe cyanescens]|uniref:Uncharacterized protein n=1 Tax=Psilocybe cyanescens TaxID=93625 RepID=A0A409XMD7_PSICY|nr:hypothetical protein CVT25_004439 [Psilocybe cyanescens]